MRLAVMFLLLLAPAQGKTPPRFELEVLYVIHSKLTAEGYKRIEMLFSKVFPDLDLTKLKPDDEDMRVHYKLYRDRLLGGAVPGTDPKLVDDEKGFKLVKDQTDRELRVRGILSYLLKEARREGSVKAVFDRFVGKDDSKRPICATESGKGLIVYRYITATASGLEDLKDSGVRFGRDFRQSVLRDARGALPAFGSRAWLLGPAGHGRCIYRLLKVHKESAPEAK